MAKSRWNRQSSSGSWYENRQRQLDKVLGRTSGSSVNKEVVDDRRPKPGRWLPMSSSRVSQARYDSGLEQIHVIFRDGTPWVYDGVERNIWRNFRRSASPGRYINRVLNGYPYWRGGFDYAEGQDTEE